MSNESLGVANEEHTCRICQLEGTENHKLFHPCKCRGSIKYIHQDCLEEWLKRSGRDGRCDICHEEYKFTTVYEENTPGIAPFKLITLIARSHLIRFLRYIVAYSSLLFGVIQIPIFWAVSRRFMDWIIDGNTTHDDFFVSLIYGNSEFVGDPYALENLADAFRYTLLSSITFLFYFTGIHLLLFVEHEWVSKDPGFEKLIKKNIGTAKIVAANNVNFNNDVINLLNENLNLLNQNQPNPLQAEQRLQNLRNLNNIRRALRDNPDVQENQALNNVLELLIRRERLAQQRQMGDLVEDEDENENEDPDFVPSDEEENTDESDEDNINQEEEMAEFERFVRFNINDRDNEARRIIANEVPDIPNIPNARIEAFPPFPAPIRPIINQPRRQPAIPQIPEPPREERPVVADANQDDFILGLPIFVIIVAADCILSGYLIVAYLVPSLVGTLIFQLMALLLSHSVSLFFKIASFLKLTPFLNQLSNSYFSFRQSVPLVDSFFNDYITTPIWNILVHVYEQKAPLTRVERYLSLGIFYGVCFVSILMFIRAKSKEHGPSNPLRGIQRKIFIALFDLVSTTKVFLIFFTELYLFPTCCGLLLEFALTPIFESKSRLIFNELFLAKDFLVVRLLISWAAGTIYMCLFALFVGMCRRYILRPGLLFFIRSPEDPNARLVHDALVRPLALQLSRIGLSGLVYTLFILIGFGAVTHSLRASGTPLLPIRIGFASNSIYGLIVGIVASSSIYHRKDIIKKYVRQYWGRAYKIACSETRLSSFILGNHDSRERGYIVYRDLNARFKGLTPDYSKPISLSEANDIFRTTNIQACFVPDGNLVRAPRNDTVSRKFVKSLFIPVTRDDIPLQSKAELQEELDKRVIDEFDESEDELVTTNNYEIVYRPPFFGTRVICFILLLWVFSVILICGIIIAGNIIGKPVILLFEGFNNIVGLEPYGLIKDATQNGILESILRIDIVSLASGLQILTMILEKFDLHLIRTHLNEGDGDPENEERVGRVMDNIVQTAGSIGLSLFYLGSEIYMMAWNNMVHIEGINKPFAYFNGLRTDEIVLNRFTYPIHAFTLLFTYVPWIMLLVKDPNEIIREGDLRGVAFKSLVQALERFCTTHLVVILGKVSLGLYEYYNHPHLYTGLTAALHYTIVNEAVYPDLIICLWPATLIIVGSIHLTIKCVKYFQKINDEVKLKFYSKGKQLENQDSVDQQAEESKQENEIETQGEEEEREQEQEANTRLELLE